MRIKSKIVFSSLLLLYVCFIQGQSKGDSLKNVLKKSKEDTGRVVVLMKLGDIYQSTDPDSAIYFHSRAQLLSEKLGEQLRAQEAASQVGTDFMMKGEYSKSLSILDILLKSIDEEAGGRKTKSLRAKVLLNMGAIHYFQADNLRALNCYLGALKISEQLNDKTGIARSLLNIGMIYRMQGDYSRALNHDLRAMKITEELKAQKLQAKVLGEIGNVYQVKHEYEEALKFYVRALEIATQMENKGGMVIWLSNIGTVLMDQSCFGEAIEYYFKTIGLAEELGDKNSLAITYGNLAQLFIELKKYNDAEKYLLKGLSINYELNALEGIQYQEKTFYELDSIRGNFHGALIHYKKFIAARDSITNEENTRQQTRMEMQYEFDKKEEQAKAAQEKKDAVAAAEKKRQNVILFSVAAFGLLVLAFAVFAYRSFLQKKKANEEISMQKELIEEKQKEILDSIYYARRIQRSLLPTEKYIARVLLAERNNSRGGFTG